MKTENEVGPVALDQNIDVSGRLYGVICSALNHCLGQAEWAQARLKPYAGRAFEIRMPPVLMKLVITSAGFFALANDPIEYDVRVTLPGHVFWALPLEGKAGLMRELHIEGRADMADTLGFVFRHLEWDLEEDLSHFFGDVLSHRVYRGLQGFMAFHQSIARRARDNVLEYLVEESPLLVSTSSGEWFKRNLLSLQENLSRLEERVNKAEVRPKRAS